MIASISNKIAISFVTLKVTKQSKVSTTKINFPFPAYSLDSKSSSQHGNNSGQTLFQKLQKVSQVANHMQAFKRQADPSRGRCFTRRTETIICHGIWGWVEILRTELCICLRILQTVIIQNLCGYLKYRSSNLSQLCMVKEDLIRNVSMVG